MPESFYEKYLILFLLTLLHIHNKQYVKNTVMGRKTANSVILIHRSINALYANTLQGFGDFIKLKAVFAGVLTADNKFPVLVVYIDRNGRRRSL